METVAVQVLGVVVFLLGTLAIGQRIRRCPTKAAAERLSRISHALFWSGLVFPELVGSLTPGLSSFDVLLGIPSLPSSALLEAMGWLFLVLGFYYLGASNLALRSDGLGFAAFKLTRRIVAKNIYEQVRNPMSLGFYLAYLGIALIAGSTYLLLGTILLVVPAHAFNLRFFEELELLARYGESYSQYRERVPFIVPRICHVRA